LLTHLLAANVSFYHCNITSRDEVKKTGGAIRSSLGSPSVLINNAGIGAARNILDATPESLRAVFDVNLISHWYTVQEFLPDMIARKKGHIMSTASMASFLGVAGMVDYCTAKVGLLAFHEGLIQELKYRYNCPEIKTTIVHPGWTRTRLIQGIGKNLKKAGIPILDPKTVADAMVKQILKVRSGQIILGPSIAFILRALPTWLQEKARDKSSQLTKVRATTSKAT
jgi:all-trans-retinol dehydrogenase (NAD+)